MIENTSSISALDLSNNAIGNSGLSTLCAALSTNSRAPPPSTVARKEVGNQAYPQFCSVVGNPTIPPAPIRLQYLKGSDHTHSTVPRVNFAHVGLTERRGQHPL